MRCAVAAIIGIFLFAGNVSGQQPAVTSITIDSGNAGRSSTHRQFIVQTREGKGYLGDNLVDQSKIDRLLTAFREPALSSPNVDNLGITRDWLQRNASPSPKDGVLSQLSLFRESFCDTELVARLVPDLFRFIKSDDYPSIRITVTLADGQSWVASSNSYYPFMLPWKVTVDAQDRRTYNADVSRAIAAILPNGSLNQSRLNGDELRQELADAVMAQVEGQWDLLGVESRALESFAILRRDFEVDRARIDSYRGYDFGFRDSDPQPYEENLEATLRRPSLPGNVTDDVVLLFHDGTIDGVTELAARIAPFESLAFSVPWLNDYLATHPEQPLYIRFVHDRSFSEKAMESFAADMKILGEDSLATDVAANQDKAALVFLDYGSDWIILPDKRMILWRHYAPASFLKWNANDFKIAECADYNDNGGGCVGVIVSPEGEIRH
jgi:hypothetical protein